MDDHLQQFKVFIRNLQPAQAAACSDQVQLFQNPTTITASLVLKECVKEFSLLFSGSIKMSTSSTSLMKQYNHQNFSKVGHSLERPAASKKGIQVRSELG